MSLPDLTPEQIADLIINRVKINLSSKLTRNQISDKAFRAYAFANNYSDKEFNILTRLSGLSKVLLTTGYVKRVLGEDLDLYERENFKSKLGSLRSALINLIIQFGIKPTELDILENIDEADNLITNYYTFQNVKDWGLNTVKNILNSINNNILDVTIQQPDESIRQSLSLDLYLQLKIIQNAINYKLSIIDLPNNIELANVWEGLGLNASQLLNKLIEQNSLIREYNFADEETKSLLRKTIRFAFVRKILEPREQD